MSLFEAGMGPRDVGDHDCAAIAAQTVLQQPGQFGIPIRNVVFLVSHIVLVECIYAVAEGEE